MTSPNEVPLERFIRIAEFRAGLRSFVRQTDRIARRFGLTPQRYLLLLQIKGTPDGGERASFTELADRLELSPNAVTDLCARAEEIGLIEREPSEVDGRVVYLRLTAEGERRLAGCVLGVEAIRSELADAFGELLETLEA